MKILRLDISINERMVHFNEDPISHSVEIQRVPTEYKDTLSQWIWSGFGSETEADAEWQVKLLHQLNYPTSAHLEF